MKVGAKNPGLDSQKSVILFLLTGIFQDSELQDSTSLHFELSKTRWNVHQKLVRTRSTR